MKSKYYFAVFITVAVISIPCCKKDNNPVTSENSQQILSGNVIDNQGNALEGVGVHYIYSLSSAKLVKTQQPNPTTHINYSIPKRCFVSLKIFRWFTRDTIETIIQDTLNSGNYSVSVNMTKYTNGLYIYRLTFDTTVVEKYLFMLNLDISSLVITNPLCKSNSDGQFKIPYGVFGFNVPILRTTESNPTVIETTYISPTIQLVLSKTGYKTIVQTLSIDTTKETLQTFKFE